MSDFELLFHTLGIISSNNYDLDETEKDYLKNNAKKTLKKV